MLTRFVTIQLRDSPTEGWIKEVEVEPRWSSTTRYHSGRGSVDGWQVPLLRVLPQV